MKLIYISLILLIFILILLYTGNNLQFYWENENYVFVFLSLIMFPVFIFVGFTIVNFLYIHTYTVVYLRKFIYKWIKNKRIRRYLDSIFLFKYYLLFFDSGIHQNERWKNYLFALLSFPFTLFLLLLPCFTCFVRYSLKQYKQKYEQLSFCFEDLPFLIQDRFIELQSPLTKKRLKHIYPWIKYDKLLIDKLHIDAEGCTLVYSLIDANDSLIHEEVDWKNKSESWNYGQSYFEDKTLKVVRISSARNYDWQLDTIKNLTVVKKVIFTSLKPFEFLFLYNNLNISMISELEILESNLTMKEFALIKNFHLKSIHLSVKLENGNCNPDMIQFFMQILVNISKIRIFFDCYYDGNFFENFIVDWIIKNGYRESFSFTFRTQHFPWYLTFSGDSLIINGFDCYQLE